MKDRIVICNLWKFKLGMKGADVEHYHTGGTFYLTVSSDESLGQCELRARAY